MFFSFNFGMVDCSCINFSGTHFVGYASLELKRSAYLLLPSAGIWRCVTLPPDFSIFLLISIYWNMYWNSLSSFSEPLLNALFHSNLFFTLNLVCPLPRIDSTSLLIVWKEFTDIMAFYSEVHLLKIIIFSSRSTIPGSHLKHLTLLSSTYSNFKFPWNVSYSCELGHKAITFYIFTLHSSFLPLSILTGTSSLSPLYFWQWVFKNLLLLF